MQGSQNEQRPLPYTTLTNWFCITEIAGVYCAVCTESLYERDTFFFQVSKQYSKEIADKILPDYWRKTVASTTHRLAIRTVGISFQHRPQSGHSKRYVGTKPEYTFHPFLFTAQTN